MRKICALMALCAVAASECMAKGIEIDTAPANVVLDLDRYMGRWYEIARFDHPFERNLEYCKTYYTRKSNGDIEVKNVGMNTAKGRIKESYGNAKISKTQGQLRVSFFLFFYSDYNILAIDDDYKWVLVGSKSPDYLWILARTPSLDQPTLKHILTLAQNRGYDTSKLIFVKQRPQ